MEKQVNENDFKVVDFMNSTDFDFTPEMGCMYDSRPIFGISGTAIKAGEKITLPYHIGMRLATNLAKAVLIKSAPAIDPKDNPVGKSLWTEEDINKLRDSFIVNSYSEEKPIAMSETDKLMAKVAELQKIVEEKLTPVEESTTMSYKDKAEIITELTKRGIKFDARSNKTNLEKLLA